ncbi:hypothetical protein PMCN03_2156 [Pasteurella multocida subsp. multocida str. HB03]|nr:hypothetical protein PMCN03_2156 [Pasteurella multocida subsp. multocida str. HB03]
MTLHKSAAEKVKFSLHFFVARLFLCACSQIHIKCVAFY